jgi:hypothetical protein
MDIENKYLPPHESVLNECKDIFDFVETHYLSIERKNVELNQLIIFFFKSLPKWLRWILNCEKMDGSKISYAVGDRIGPFHLFYLNKNEAILGINGRHLDYRISIMTERKNNNRLCLSTTFTLNDFLGKYYFFMVKTFYRLTTPHLLQAMTNHLYAYQNP